jgi:hypothetical protein
MSENLVSTILELLNDLVKAQQNTVDAFIDRISVRYSLNELELRTLWTGSDPDTVATLVNDDNKCTHTFTKGQRIGQQCGQKNSGNTTKCSKHQKKLKEQRSTTAASTTITTSSTTVTDDGMRDIPLMFSKITSVLASDTEDSSD